MKQPRDQHWADLLAALEREADAIGGYGELHLVILFHAGEPRDVQIEGRRPRYKLGVPDSVLRQK